MQWSEFLTCGNKKHYYKKCVLFGYEQVAEADCEYPLDFCSYSVHLIDNAFMLASSIRQTFLESSSNGIFCGELNQ